MRSGITERKAASLLREIEPDLNSDPWGGIMGAWFAIAAELDWRGECLPPDWDYKPPAVNGDYRETGECYAADICTELTTEELLAAGNLAERVAGILKRQGRSY